MGMFDDERKRGGNGDVSRPAGIAARLAGSGARAVSAGSTTGLDGIWRYGLALVGPVGTAGGQFLLTLILLHRLDEPGFGRFTFLVILAQFVWAISLAMFGAPLAKLHAGGDAQDRDRSTDGVFGVNMSFALLAGAAGAVTAYLLDESTGGAALFGIVVGAGALRSFARALAYAQFRQMRVAASDLVYTAILLAGSLAAWRIAHPPSCLAFLVMATAMAVGLLPFGGAFLARLFEMPSLAGVRAYRGVWRQYSRWSLLGVVTTETTANAHAYLVTLLLGPAAFAPIAASGLLVRPLTVATNAFCELERTRLARAIADRDEREFGRTLRFFRAILILSWVGAAVAAALMLSLDPDLFFPKDYPLAVIATGAALWMGLSAVRMSCMPEAITLQAAGAFRPLAIVSVWSAPVSIAAVCATIVLAGPIWSLLGVVIGAALSAVLLLRATRLWLDPESHGDRPFPRVD